MKINLLNKLLIATFITVSLAFTRIGWVTENTPSFAGQWLRGAGSTFAAPLYESWMVAFKKAHPELLTSYEVVGSGEGISKFLAGAVDFAGTDAPLTVEQIQRVDRGVLHIPSTAGMIVLAYNVPDLEGPLRLPRTVYADILAGKITKWNDPRIQSANPDLALPNLSIVVVARQDSSGTTFALTHHLSAISPDWRQQQGVGKVMDWPGNAMLARGNEGVARRIKLSWGSIGYVEYGIAQRLGLPMAVLENQAGQFVQATPQTGQEAIAAAAIDMPDDFRLLIADPPGESSYPLVSLSWSLLYQHYPTPIKASVVRNFLDWGLTDGQKLAAKLGYIPLPATVASRAHEAIQALP